MPLRLEGSVEIARPLEDVFAFVSDPRNDPAWCERVEWCRQVAGEGAEIGANYEARHRPSGYPWPHVRRIEVIAADPPRSIRWQQADHLARFDITYELTAMDRARTKLRQIDEIRWRLPAMGLIGKRIVRRHIGEQHDALRALLESSA